MLRRRDAGLRLGLVVAFGPALLVAACTSPNPALYTIAPIQGTPQMEAPRIIRVRTIGLARYLERPQMVRSSEDYRLDVMANDWWGEPLGAMLGRTLVAELTQRLPGSTVYLEGGAISADADATVEINIQRMDQDVRGQLVLAAQVAISGRHPDARSVRFMVTPPDATMTGFASATSTAVGQLADTVTGMLAG